VHVADRAADDVNFMEACARSGSGFVVRARHDRRINGGDRRLWEHMRSLPVAGHRSVRLGCQRDDRGRITQKEREATVSIRVDRVTLEPPSHHRAGDHQPRAVWVVYLHEDDAAATPSLQASVDGPEGHGESHGDSDSDGDGAAVDWMLLCSEPVNDPASAQQVIDWYQHRWVIEEWHRALKEGCRAEMSQLDQPEDHLRLAAILSVIAVRLLQLRDMADPACPESDDPQALQRWASPTWIKVVARLAKSEPARMTPRLFFLTVAKRGGYLGRKRDPRPGWKVLWRGWYDINLMVEGVELANEQPPPVRSG
jgi:hypothetical protein